MTAALTLMAKERGGIPLAQQVLFYPVTDAAFDTPSYHQFATGYFLRRDGMQWFWDQYTTDPGERAQITASPLRATTEQLRGLPPALVITAEADVLRDEGEAYANKLREAGVPVTAVRFQGIIHDFVMLNALRGTHAAEAAITMAARTLHTALHTARAPGAVRASRAVAPSPPAPGRRGGRTGPYPAPAVRPRAPARPGRAVPATAGHRPYRLPAGPTAAARARRTRGGAGAPWTAGPPGAKAGGCAGGCGAGAVRSSRRRRSHHATAAVYSAILSTSSATTCQFASAAVSSLFSPSTTAAETPKAKRLLTVCRAIDASSPPVRR